MKNAEVREYVIEYLYEEISKEHPHFLVGTLQCFLVYNQESGTWYLDDEDIWVTKSVMNVLKMNDTNKNFSARAIKDIVAKYKLDRYSDIVPYSEFLAEYNHFSRLYMEDSVFSVNVRNGLVELDIDARNIILRSFNPKLKLLSHLNVKYDDKATCELFLKIMNDVIPDKKDQELFRYFIAYCIINRFFAWESVLLLFGDGANGKGTLLYPIVEAMFVEVERQKLYEMMKDTHGTSSLLDKQLWYASESNRLVSDTSLIKSITSGEPISVRPMHKKPMKALIDAKMIITANRLPSLEGEGDFRRFLMVRCPNKFKGKKDDPYMREKLQSEGPGILNWILEVIPDLLDNLPKIKKGLSERTEKMLSIYSDVIGVFIENYTYVDMENMVSTKEMMMAYEAYRTHFKLDKKDIRAIGRRLTKRYRVMERYDKAFDRGYKNISLQADKLSELYPNWDAVEEKDRGVNLYNFMDDGWAEDSYVSDKKDEFMDAVAKMTVIEPVSLESLVEKAKDYDIDRSYVISLLDDMKQNGVLYTPKTGMYAWVRS